VHHITMATVTKTLKLPFLRLNRVKAEELARLQARNTEVANAILAMPKAERRKLTTRSFAQIEIGSAWINQTIRKTIARTRVRRFRCLPLETSNQNWTLHKVGETWSVSFGLLRGSKKRVPIEVHTASHRECLEALLDGRARAGSLKLVQSRKGIWYACISVSLEVPDTRPTGRWIGVDRGQNIPAVAATADGPVIFYKLGRIRHLRRIYAERRKKLQKAGKHRALRKLGDKEHRIVTAINHVVSKDIVSLARRQGAGIRLEDLSGIRQSAKQRKARKSDAGQNRDYWPFYQLEQFTSYKARLAGVPVEKVPAAYTSQGCHACGRINRRDKHAYRCERCGRQAHADANAAMNIRDWEGLCCPLVLEAPADGPYDPALKRVSETVVQAAA
jgi:putative transposase